jgi:4-amino-4-deoxy-L-arabinose transferase-like glycosyltransferase
MVFALVWFVCVFLIFSFSRSKIPHYILPAYPAAALLVGIFLDRIADKPEDAAWWRVPMCLVAAGSLAVALVLLRSMPVLMAEAPATVRLLAPILVAGGGLAIGIAVWRRSAIGAALSLALALSVVLAVIGSVVVPAAIEPFKPMPSLAREAARLTDPGEPIGLLGMYGAASVIYYSQHRIQHLQDDDTAVSFVTRAPHVACLMPASDFERLKPRLPPSIRVVASSEEFNVRLSRLIERKTSPGRRWVLISRQQ